MSNDRQEIIEIILEIIEMDEDEIGGDEEFTNFEHIDSLKALDILTELERKYNIKLPESEMRNFLTINQIVEVVERHVPALATECPSLYNYSIEEDKAVA